MKKIFLFATLIVGLCLTQSCSDPCSDVDCNGGTCNDGTCECIGNFTGTDCRTCKDQFTGAECDMCIEGFEGEDCAIEIRDKYLGTYEGALSCEGLIDLEAFGFGELTLILEADPDNILEVTVFTPTLPFQIFDMAIVGEDRLAIPTSSQTIDLSDIPEIPLDEIPLTTNGEIILLSEDQIELTINFIVPLVGTTQCTAVLDRL